MRCVEAVMECEDRLEYALYPVTGHSLSPTDTLAVICSTLTPFTRQWVWHRDQFRLHVAIEGERWHLVGSLHYGENVMDEWFVVSLLCHVTKELPSLVARVTDTDGEILLIEAASVLPLWAAEPSVAEGRVFVASGQVHLIPVATSPASVTSLPCVTPPPHIAAQVVASYPRLTLASEAVQGAIEKRLQGMPYTTSPNHHRINVLLPWPLLRMLRADNGLLARLVAAVLERDAKDTRAVRQMKEVGGTREEELVMARITFSKCLYAMLSTVSLQPYKGSCWQQTNKQTQPTTAQQIGYKLAAGLEILLARCDTSTHTATDPQKFNEFVTKLKEINYFQGELEGSKKYKELLNDCKSFWISSTEHEREKRRDIAEQFAAAKAEESTELGNSFLVSVAGEEDSEDWLQLTPQALESLLETQFGVKASSAGGDIPEQVEKFLGRVSDMAGVEEEEEDIELDHDNLMRTMKKLMTEMTGEEFGEDSDSDISGEDCFGDSDPVMQDYLGRMDGEVLAEATGRRDLPDLESPLEVGDSVRSNLLKAYSAQSDLGGHGPASSLFQSLKLNPGRPN